MAHFLITLQNRVILCNTLQECSERVTEHIRQSNKTASNFHDIEVRHTKYKRVGYIAYSGKVMSLNRTLHRFTNVTADNY